MDSAASDWQSKITAAQSGDREALGEIFRILRTSLQSMAQGQMDPQLQVKVSSSDIVQETLIEAYRGLGAFHGTTRGELLAWLHGILTHRILTANRRFRGAAKRNLDCERSLTRSEGSQALPLLAHDLSSPSQHAAANEEAAQLEAALRQLPARQEQVIRLRNELRLSFAEIATMLDCSTDAAQKLWSRAISQLARKLNAYAKDRG